MADRVLGTSFLYLQEEVILEDRVTLFAITSRPLLAV